MQGLTAISLSLNEGQVKFFQVTKIHGKD